MATTLTTAARATGAAPQTNMPMVEVPDDHEPVLRVGFLTHLDNTDDPRAVYDDNLALFKGLEELGYHSAWIATRHFNSGFAGLPTPFAFLGAAARETSRIGLGTALLPVVTDDPVRDGEEISVVDYLSAGRLMLGVGKGVPSDAYHVFGRWSAQREESFDAKIDALHWTLRGSQVDGSAARMFPANEPMRGRMFHGTSTLATIHRAAMLGDGFLLERFGNTPEERQPGGRREFHLRQLFTILEYRRVFARTWGSRRSPHVVLSRSAWPGVSNEAALAEVAPGAERWAHNAGPARFNLGLSTADKLLSDNVIWGTPSEIAADLLADPGVAASDELVLGLQPGIWDVPLALEKAEVLLREVMPLVEAGWRDQQAAFAETQAAHDTRVEAIGPEAVLAETLEGVKQ